MTAINEQAMQTWCHGVNKEGYLKVTRLDREWYLLKRKVSGADILFMETDGVMITPLSDGHWVAFQNLKPSSRAKSPGIA